MVRITSGDTLRLRLMGVQTRTNRGRRFRGFVAFFLSFLLAAYGFYGANSLAQETPVWGGTVEVRVDGTTSTSSFSLNLNAGESKTYSIRLTEQPLANQNGGKWWVRIHVNNMVMADGQYPKGEKNDAMITWVPSVGWEFNTNNWNQWRSVTIRARKDITEPITFSHEVWATSDWCPIHDVGVITVSSSITSTPGTNTPDTTNNPIIVNRDTTNPGNINPDTTNPGNINPGTNNPDINTNPDTTNPGNINPGTNNPDINTNPDTTNPGNNNDGNGDNNGGNNPGDTDDGTGGGGTTKSPTQPEPPAPIGATVDGNKLVLTYNEPLDTGSKPAPGDFTVSGHEVESLSLSGSIVTMTLETPAMPGEEVTLSYAPGKKPIKNRTGVDAESFTNMPVENIGKAPVLMDTRAQGDQITLTYDEPLDETSVPTTGSYAVTVDGANHDVSKVEINGRKVKLTLESAVTPGDEVTLNYTPGTPRIVDLTEIPAGPINNININNPKKTVRDRTEGTNDWLTRFGRTVASQAVETIENRIKAPSMRQASQMTISGQDVDFFGDDASPPLAQEDAEFVSASRLASSTLGFGGIAGNDSATSHREISMSDLMLASSFHLASVQTMDNGQDTLWTTWGKGARTSFFGDEDSSTFKGDVTTGTLGADFEWGRTMVGVALSHTLGEGFFSIDGRRNDVEARLTGAYPYIRYTLSEHLTIWGMFGFGNGEYTQQEEGIENIETDISMRMGAIGFRSALFPIAQQIGYDLAVKGDVMVVEVEADEIRDKLLPVDTNTNRFRLLLEGSREYKVGHGASITPSLAMGVRYDKGDAEEGGGIELSGGLRFFDPSLDMVIDVNARSLLLHEESRFSEMGVSGSIHFTWGTKKKGLSVRVGSSWGDAASGAERLWSQASTTSLRSAVKSGDTRLEAEVGYGMDAPSGGVFTPYAGLGLNERKEETYRVGGRLQVGDFVSLRLEGDRRERVGGRSSHGLALLGSVHW